MYVGTLGQGLGEEGINTNWRPPRCKWLMSYLQNTNRTAGALSAIPKLRTPRGYLGSSSVTTHHGQLSMPATRRLAHRCPLVPKGR